jgi:hypothetical protein
MSQCGHGRLAKLWLNKLADLNRKRARYQEMAAESLIGFVELKARVAEIHQSRRTADRELRECRRCREQIRQLEQDKDALLEYYAGLVPEALDGLDAAECHRVYGMLRVEAAISPDGSLEVSGDVINVCEMELSSL